MFLLGGKEEIARKAAEKLKEKFPNLNICGTHHGYFDTSGEENNILVQKLISLRPDIIFVCMGFPLQEKWIVENVTKLPSVSLAIGLGGSLDVWSENIKRAPFFIQQLGAEWLWRSLKEPKRLRVFYDIPNFMFSVIKQKSVLH